MVSLPPADAAHVHWPPDRSATQAKCYVSGPITDKLKYWQSCSPVSPSGISDKCLCCYGLQHYWWKGRLLNLTLYYFIRKTLTFSPLSRTVSSLFTSPFQQLLHLPAKLKAGSGRADGVGRGFYKRIKNTYCKVYWHVSQIKRSKHDTLSISILQSEVWTAHFKFLEM